MWEEYDMKSSRLILVVSAMILTGCGGSISLKSTAFPTTGATGLRVSLPNLAVSTPTANVETFKICITSIRLVNDSEETQGKDGSDDIEFKPGLIDLSDGQEKDWGSVSTPVGFKLKRLRVKVHHDPDLCGVDPSIQFNTATTQQDVELKFRFDPAIDLAEDDTLALNINALVQNLREAVDAGTISSLKDRIEEVESSGTK
jgi:hypothetical protein